MTWVCAKVLGDGRAAIRPDDDDTAFHVAIQRMPVSVKGFPVELIPTGKDGLPVAAYAMLEIVDGDEAKLAGNKDCYVVPKFTTALGLAEKQELQTGLRAQGCDMDLSAATTIDDVVLAAQMKIVQAQPPGEATLP